MTSRVIGACVGACAAVVACSGASDEGLYEPMPSATASGGSAGVASGGGGTGAVSMGGNTPVGGSAGTTPMVTTGGTGNAGGSGGTGGTAPGGSGGVAGSVEPPDAGVEASVGTPDGAADAALACDPGAAMCDGDVATTCESDGSGPVAGGTDCAAQSATCVDGACVPNCAPGALGCACEADAGCGSGLYCETNNLCAAVSPVAHWAFEDNVLDSSGNVQHGTEQTSLSYTDGVGGRAVQFNRNDGDYVEIDIFADEFAAMMGAFTLFMRVRLADYSSGQTQVLFGMGAPGETQATNEFRFIFEDGVVIETETGSGTNHLVTLGPLPSFDVWHEYVFTVEGPIVRYYFDGAFVSENTFTVSDTTSNRMVIGSWQDGHTLQGDIDDVKVFDSVLTDTQIATLWGSN